MITMIKPSGVEVQVDINSVDYALTLGWRVKTEEVATEKKRGKTKEA